MAMSSAAASRFVMAFVGRVRVRFRFRVRVRVRVRVRKLRGEARKPSARGCN